MTPVLEAIAIEKSFGGVRALKGVSLRAYAGEVHALVGENGAGKSTLIKTFAGAIAPDGGRILLDGADAGPFTPAKSRSLGIAVIYQQPACSPALRSPRTSLWLANPASFGAAYMYVSGSGTQPRFSAAWEPTSGLSLSPARSPCPSSSWWKSLRLWMPTHEW